MKSIPTCVDENSWRNVIGHCLKNNIISQNLTIIYTLSSSIFHLDLVLTTLMLSNNQTKHPFLLH